MKKIILSIIIFTISSNAWSHIEHYSKFNYLEYELSRNNKLIGYHKYDFLIPINYNTKQTRLGKGSAIFLHLTKDFRPTEGCIAVKKKEFLILLKLINKNTKIKII